MDEIKRCNELSILPSIIQGGEYGRDGEGICVDWDWRLAPDERRLEQGGSLVNGPMGSTCRIYAKMKTAYVGRMNEGSTLGPPK